VNTPLSVCRVKTQITQKVRLDPWCVHNRLSTPTLRINLNEHRIEQKKNQRNFKLFFDEIICGFFARFLLDFLQTNCYKLYLQTDNFV
jgi:hypothetical protein